MVPYHEILRQISLGIALSRIARSCQCTRNTKNVLRHAQERGIAWPLEPEMTNEQLYRELFQKKHTRCSARNPMLPLTVTWRKVTLR